MVAMALQTELNRTGENCTVLNCIDENCTVLNCIDENCAVLMKTVFMRTVLY